MHFSDLGNESIEQLYQHYNIDFATFTRMSMEELNELYEKFKKSDKTVKDLNVDDSEAQSMEGGGSGKGIPNPAALIYS